MRKTIASLLLVAASAASAQTVLLNDDFNGENGGVGAAEYSGFANFSVANVDLLAPGYFFNLCQLAGGSSACVDMEGSGNGAMTTKLAYDIAPGSVTIRFDLAGDQRGHDNNSVTASLVDIFGNALFSETFSLAGSAAFTSFSRTVDVTQATSLRLRFLSGGPADSFGMLLDNVSMTTAPVPEPAHGLMLLAGLGLVGSVVARRQAR